jgi:hypothetical protein
MLAIGHAALTLGRLEDRGTWPLLLPMGFEPEHEFLLKHEK